MDTGHRHDHHHHQNHSRHHHRHDYDNLINRDPVCVMALVVSALIVLLCIYARFSRYINVYMKIVAMR